MRKSTKKAQIILVISPIWEIEISAEFNHLVTMSELKLAWKKVCPIPWGSPASLSFPDRLEQRLKEEN